MKEFLWGALTTLALVSGLLFFRYGKLTRDRLFFFFGAGFCVLALDWFLIAVTNPPSETRHHTFVVRLAAFALVLVGIVDKNRRARAAAD